MKIFKNWKQKQKKIHTDFFSENFSFCHLSYTVPHLIHNVVEHLWVVYLELLKEGRIFGVNPFHLVPLV